MDSVKDEIAKNLLFYRKKAKLTQKELADKLGIKHNSISSWENGTNSIDVEILFKICKIFDVSINDMYGKFAILKKNEYTEHEKSVLSAYKSQPEQVKKAVDRLLCVPECRPIQDDMEISDDLLSLSENDSCDIVKSKPKV